MSLYITPDIFVYFTEYLIAIYLFTYFHCLIDAYNTFTGKHVLTLVFKSIRFRIWRMKIIVFWRVLVCYLVISTRNISVGFIESSWITTWDTLEILFSTEIMELAFLNFKICNTYLCYLWLQPNKYNLLSWND